MTIESAQLDDLAVELEAVIGELGLAEAEAAGIFVEDLRRRGAGERAQSRDCGSRDPRA